MFRRFVIVILLFLVVVVVAADRVGAIVGAHVLASKVQTDEHLATRPSASIGGIPFLTQAFSGKYNDVTITDNAVRVDGVTVTKLTVNLHGVHVPLSKIVHGSVSRVPVDTATATAFLSFSDANAYLRNHVPGGEVVRLSAGPHDTTMATVTATVAGQPVTIHGAARATVSGNVIAVAVNNVVNSGLAGSVLNHLLSALNVQLPFRSLPFQIQLHGVSMTAAGLTATGSASNIVLGSHRSS